MTENLARIALASTNGMSRYRFKAVIAHFGSASEAFNVNVGVLREVSRMSISAAERIIERRKELSAVAAHWERLERAGVEARFCDDERYPAWLANVADAPPMLLTRGVERFPEKAVAIVGRREPSKVGRDAARFVARKARELGWCVVSGLARGIDTEAHRGALERGFEDGRDEAATVGVAPSDLLSIYPRENTALAREIGKRGVLVSEQFGGEIQRWHFVHRNRLISGLSKGVVVIEAGERDGSLHTVRFAEKQRRDIAVWDWSRAPETSPGTVELEKRGAAAYNTATLSEWFERLSGDEPFAAPWLLFGARHWRSLKVAID